MTEQTTLSDGDTTIDPAQFRRVMATYPTGITVLTATHQGQPVGMSANSFTSVSLDPPLVLFCAAYSSSTWPQIEAAGHFVVNVMPATAEDLAAQFASKGIDRFEGIDFATGVSGGPVLAAARSYLECEIDAIHEAGDHAVVIGRVVAMGERDEQPPLIFYRSEYRRLEPTD